MSSYSCQEHGTQFSDDCVACDCAKDFAELEAQLATAQKVGKLYTRFMKDVVKLTEAWEEHPENWDWPCACKECMEVGGKGPLLDMMDAAKGE